MIHLQDPRYRGWARPVAGDHMRNSSKKEELSSAAWVLVLNTCVLESATSLRDKRPDAISHHSKGVMSKLCVWFYAVALKRKTGVPPLISNELSPSTSL